MRKYIDIINENLHGSVISDINVEDFVISYIETMLWSSSDSGDQNLNELYTVNDIDPQAMDRIMADCRSFLHKVGPWITEENYKGPPVTSVTVAAGHDFWLTRCGHGAGFWDGDWASEETLEGPLTKAAKAFGCIDPYVGDDGKIHLA